MPTTSHTEPPRGARPHRYHFPALWLLFAVIIGGHHIGTSFPPGAPNIGSALAFGVLSGLFWAVVTPLIFRITQRRPFSRRSWLVPTAIHLAVMIACALFNGMLAGVIVVAGGLAPDSTIIGLVISNTITSVMSLYIALVTVGTVLESRARAARAEQAAVEATRLSAEARQHALRAQLQPHFLFNALNTVVMAVRREDREEAVSTVLGLSALLRTSLRNGSEMVRLSEELAFIEQYLQIEQVRFRDRLAVTWSVAPAARDAAVPVMILQPIVENAIHHGIARSSSAGQLGLRIAVQEARLEITVEDDGPGFASDWSQGVGLASVRDRLRLHYGEDAALQTWNRERGAAVRVSLPFNILHDDAEVPAADRR